MISLKDYRVIAGAGGKAGAAAGRVAVEDDDSLKSRAMVSIVDLIGEGQIGGLVNGAKSIYFNDTPLQNEDGSSNFLGFTWEVRNGTQDQTALTGDGYDAVETPFQMNVQVKATTPATLTITNQNADEVRVTVGIPALTSQDMTNGDVHGTDVSFKFQISTNGGSFTDAGEMQTISGKVRSRYEKDYTIPLPKTTSAGIVATTWSIKMIRLTADSTTSSLTNDTNLNVYTEVVKTKLSYPNSAIVGVSIDSSQFNSIPKRAYKVNGLLIKVPINYDPITRIYTGSWNGAFKLASSSNPAWILYDLLLMKRYGIGNHIDATMIDLSKLYQIGRYCDQMVDDGFGGMEPRFTINTVIQQASEAYRLIMDISSAFNGMTYWTGGQLGFTQDAPDTPVMMYSRANVIDKFTYMSSSRKDRHTCVYVTWNDPTQNYKQAVEYVEDGDLITQFGVRKANIIAFGCTSRGQAARTGRWLLYSEHYQSEMVQFSVGIDSALVMPGDIIQIQDPDKSGKRLAGRILAAAPTLISLDALVAIDPNSTISLRLPDGTLQNRIIHSFDNSGETTVVTLALALTEVPLANSIWLISSDDLEPQICRVVSINQGKDHGTFNIAAVQYNGSKFAAIENGAQLEIPKVSILNTLTQEAPTVVTITQELSVAQGLSINTMSIHWLQAVGAVKYRVEFKKNNGNWIPLGDTGATTIDVKGIYTGNYIAKVIAISASDIESIPSYSILTGITGKTGAPPALASITATGRLFGMDVDWQYPQGVDDTAYTEIEQATNAGGTDATLLSSLAYPTNKTTQQGLAAGVTLFYRGRLVDRLQNVGPWSNWVSGTTSTDAGAVLELLAGQITSSQLDEALSSAIASGGEAGVAVETLSTTVDGLSGQYTVKIDNHGWISGFGLSSEASINDDPTSTFGVRADKFYIGTPLSQGGATTNNPVIPFIVTTTSTTVNGVTVPPGVYIQEAMIKNASIDLAKINTASITNLSALSATIGTFQSAPSGARTKIQDTLIQVFDSAGTLRVQLGVW